MHPKANPDEINASFLATQNPPGPGTESVPIECIIQDLSSSPIHLTPAEVLRRLQCVKKKSAGPDSYLYWILRDYVHILHPPITQLFNLYLKECTMPTCFKEATIMPVPKPGCSTPEYRHYYLIY